MKDLKINTNVINIIVIILIIYLILFTSSVEQILVAILICNVMIYRVTFLKKLYRHRVPLFLTYSFVLLLQVGFFVLNRDINSSYPYKIFMNTVGVGILFIPIIIEQAVGNKKEINFKNLKYYEILSFAGIKKNISLSTEIDDLKKIREVLTYKNISEIVQDIPRHSAIRYINKGTLSQEYFDVAYNNLIDPYIYLVVSNTGSSASQVISVFTKREFSHISVAFDKDLFTTISYNGGERVYPPGLNQEMLEYFKKKDDASILVYGLKVGHMNKYKMIEKIKQINNEGSAYNLLGLVFNVPSRQNTMYCSQFVYYLLLLGNANYLPINTVNENNIKPTDFIELDYTRKLEFLYKLEL
ncbi:MAG: hypothetical protein ACK5LY_08430 [Lachnospirales bacterium]